MATTTMQSVLSADGSLAAVVAPSSSSSSRLLIQVYQIGASSCSLQLTLTHSTQNALKDLVFCGNSMVAGLMGTSEVLVWDLERGVVANKMMASTEDQDFLALAASDEKHFSILTKHSQKLFVYDYLASSNKLTRKIKSGRFEGEGDEAFLAVSKKHVVVQTSAGARIMDRESGNKVGKIKSKKLSRIFICPSDSNVLVGVQNSGAVVLYSISTAKKLASVPQVLSSSTFALQLEKQNQDEHILLADHTLYNIKGSSSDKLAQIDSSRPTAMFLIQQKLLALIHQKTGGCQAEWIDLQADDLPTTVKLGTQQQEKKEPESMETSKRKKSSETQILGPGQAGAEMAPPTKKAKAASDENNEASEEDAAKEISIAERLQQLSNAMDDDDDEDDDEEDDTPGPKTSFKPRKATTESLKELLSQALQSGDDALLELALGVRDSKVISTTLKEIEPSLILVLVSKLTTRLASTPMRAEQLATWLSFCLKTGRFRPQHLTALRNLLFERIESFSDLLRLEGRLSMMCDVE